MQLCHLKILDNIDRHDTRQRELEYRFLITKPHYIHLIITVEKKIKSCKLKVNIKLFSIINP